MAEEKEIKQTILVVDDNEDNVFLLEHLLTAQGYAVIPAYGGEEAMKIIETRQTGVDLIVLDIMMPGMDGLEVTRRVKQSAELRIIPIMLLTAGRSNNEDVAKGLDIGADDYLIKPAERVELMARVRSLLRSKRLQDELTEKRRKLEEMNDHLQQLVEERTIEILLTRDAAIFGLAKLAENRDPETGAHLERIRNYTRALAQRLKKNPKFEPVVNDEFVGKIYQSSPLHDIGKVGIPDHILLKPGKLTPEEFEVMKRHSAIGGDSLAAAQRGDDSAENFLSMGRDIAYYHHEKWNGTGYPKGLKGEEIPLSARIMALADVYDALVSKRVYKEPMTHEDAREIIMHGSGTHFDPDIAQTFFAIEKEFKNIRADFEDEPVLRH
ncbi:MAG: two-component system response regulator [Nitrospinae bacterium]|nr:two-component system response regulator [Nitrospinota bacterium]